MARSPLTERPFLHVARTKYIDSVRAAYGFCDFRHKLEGIVSGVLQVWVAILAHSLCCFSWPNCPIGPFLSQANFQRQASHNPQHRSAIDRSSCSPDTVSSQRHTGPAIPSPRRCREARAHSGTLVRLHSLGPGAQFSGHGSGRKEARVQRLLWGSRRWAFFVGP